MLLGAEGLGGFQVLPCLCVSAAKSSPTPFAAGVPSPAGAEWGCAGDMSLCVCVMSVCRVSGYVCGCLLTAPVQVNTEGSWWVCAAFPWAGKLQVVSPWAKWNPSIFDSEHHSFAELDVE